MSSPMKPPSSEYLARINLLTVNTETGKVYKDSKEVGSVDTSPKSGYVHISVYGPDGCRHWKRANIVWWKHTGEWPTLPLDHIDRNKTNDAISNLRVCTNDRVNANNRGLEISRLKLEEMSRG